MAIAFSEKKEKTLKSSQLLFSHETDRDLCFLPETNGTGVQMDKICLLIVADTAGL
jgi:hypothetical protein